MNKAREADILAKGIIESIESVTKSILRKRGCEQTYDGLVVSVNNDKNTADVDLVYDTIYNLPNKTGEDLKVGDGVRVFAKSIMLTDAYIGLVLPTERR